MVVAIISISIGGARILCFGENVQIRNETQVLPTFLLVPHFPSYDTDGEEQRFQGISAHGVGSGLVNVQNNRDDEWSAGVGPFFLCGDLIHFQKFYSFAVPGTGDNFVISISNTRRKSCVRNPGTVAVHGEIVHVAENASVVEEGL